MSVTENEIKLETTISVVVDGERVGGFVVTVDSSRVGLGVLASLCAGILDNVDLARAVVLGKEPASGEPAGSSGEDSDGAKQ